MTTSRFSFLTAFGVIQAGCQQTAAPSAQACPEQPLSSALERYSPDREQSAKLAKCLTEQAVGLSPAGGSSADVASAVVTACYAELALFEVEAGIREFEWEAKAAMSGQPKPSMGSGKQEVRTEANRYALTRIVQVRAGQCNGTSRK